MPARCSPVARPTLPVPPRGAGGAAVLCGLLLGGLVGLAIGPHSLSPGPRFSGDQQLAGDFRATLGDDLGLGWSRWPGCATAR